MMRNKRDICILIDSKIWKINRLSKQVVLFGIAAKLTWKLFLKVHWRNLLMAKKIIYKNRV